MKMLYVLSPPRTPPPSPWTSMRDSSPSSCPSSNSNSSSSINSSCSYASSQSERRCGDGGSNQRDVSSTYPLRGGVSTNGRRGSTDISSNLLRKKDISTNLLREDNISTNLLRGEDTSTRRRSAGVSTNDYFQRSPISTFPGDAMSRKGFTSSLSAGRLPLLDGREKICPSAKIMPGIRVSQSEKSFGRSLEPGYSLRCSQSERRCDGRDSTLSVPRPGRGNTVPEIVAGGKQSKATRNWLKAIEKANARGAVASPAGNYGPAREAIDARGARLPGGNFPSTELPVSHGAEESVPAGGWECARKGSEGEREAPPRRFTKTVKCRLKRKDSGTGTSTEDEETSKPSSRSLSECYFAVPLPFNPHPPRVSSPSSDIQKHLQSMFGVLRPQETLKMAVKLESVHPDRTRYLVVVSCDEQGDESCLLGIDCNQTTTVGLVLRVLADTSITLDGDGGFSVCVCGRQHIFKPVSVQAMWSALQSLHKVSSVARDKNYFLNGGSHEWVSHYEAKIASDRSCLNEWHAMDSLESRRPPSPDSLRDKPSQRDETEKIIRSTLKEIIMSVDLDEVTSKYIRSRLEDIMDSDLGEYKSFIDQEMFNILKQMDAATEIFPHVYLGSEWNASNLEELARNGVCHILNVTREIDNFFPGIFDYCNIRVYDDDKTDLLKHWDNTYKYITSAKNQGSKVLVHCKMGISRSASVVIAYAMKAYNWDLTRAMAHVRQKRNCIKPNANFITQLETYQGILDAMKNREKLQRSKSETNLKCNVAVSTRGTSSGGHSQKLGNSAEARSSSVTKEDPAHLLMFDRTGAATPPPSRSLSPHHDPTGYLSPHHDPTGYLSPNDPTGYFTTHHDPSGFLSPDDPTGYLSPHHDPTGFLSTHDPSGYLSHDPTGYLSPHRGTPGSELALSGSRPKSWSPDALEVSTLFETSAPPTSQSLERLTTPSDRAPSPSSPSSLLPTTPPSIPPAPPLPPAPKMYNVNVRMPCGNGLAYSVSQNKVLHLDCTQSPRTIEGGVKSRVYALEANAHPHDGAPPQPSLLSQQIASTVTSMDKKSPPRPRQSISTNTDNTSSSGAMPNSVISLTSQFEPSTSHPTTSSSTTQPSHLVKPRGLRKYLKFMNKSSSSEGKTEGKKSDKNSSEGKNTSDAGKISSSMGKIPSNEGKNVSHAGKNAASVGKILSSEAKIFGGRQPLAPANSESAGREISSRLQGLSPANISPSPLPNSHAVRVNLSRQDSWSSQDSAIGPDCSGAVSRQSSWGSYEAGPRGTCRASSLGSYDTEGRGSEGRNFPCNCEGTKVGHFPSKGDCNCGIEGKNHFPSKGDCSCEGTKGGHFPSKDDSNCGSEGTRGHFPSKGEFHCNCLSSSGSLVPLSSQAESNLTQGVGNQSSFRRKHTSESGALSSSSCPTHDISSSTSPPCSESIATCSESIATCSESIATCSESIATCSESIATCSESLDSCVKTSRSDTNEHQSTTPSGVKPSSTTKGDIKDLKPRSTSEGSDVKPTSTNISSDAKPSSPPRRRICACFRRNSDTREGGGTQDRYTPAPGGCAKDRTADVSGNKVPGGSKPRTGEISGNKVLEGCTKDQTDPRGSSKVPGGCQKDQTDLRGSSKDPNRCSKFQSAEISGRKVDKSTSGGPEVNLGADRINTDPGGHKGDPGGSYETDRKIAATHCISSVILRKKFYASGSGVSSQSKDRFESLQSSEGTRQGNSTFYVTSRQGGSNGDLSGRAMCDTNSDNTRNSNIGGNSHEGNSRHSCGNFNEGENSHEGNTHIQSSPSNAPCITRGSTSSPSIQHIASTVSLPSPPPPSRPLSQSLFNYSNSYPTPFSAHAHKLKHHHHLSRSFPSVIGSSSGTLGSLPPRSNCDNAPAHWSTRATNQNARPVHSCDVSTNHSAGGGASRFRVVSIATSSQSLNEGTRSSRVSPKRSLSVEEKRKHPNAKETGMVKNLKDEFEAKTESGLKHRRHHSSSSMTCTCEGNSHSRGNFNEGNSHEGHSRHSCGNFVETVPDRTDLNNQAGNKLDVRVDIREVGGLKADTCDTVRSQDDNVFETQGERNFTPGSMVPRGFNRVNENPNRVNSRLENPAGNESRTHDLTATHPPHTLPVVRKCVHKQAHAQTKSPATEHKKSVKKIVGKFEQKSDNENRRGNEQCIADSVSESRRGTNESRRGNEPCIADGVQDNRRGNVVDSFMKYIDDISVREKGAGAVLPLLVVDAARGREGEGEPRLTTANAPPIYNTM